MGNILTKYRSFLICLALTVATTAVFWQVCTYDFINYDDPRCISENPNIQAGITPKTIKWAFTTGYAANWHPLTWLSHMLDWQLFGLKPAGHHFTNLVFHIANTLLLFIVLKRMTNAFWPSAFIAALFALHPLHVESVAWVTERKDVLSTFFWLLTMAAYLRYVKHPGVVCYLLTLLTFALGLMAKPMLVTLPFVLLLLDYWPLARIPCGQTVGKTDRQNKKHINILSYQRILYHLIWEKIPFFVLSAGSCVVTFLAQRSGGSVAAIAAVPLKFRISNALVSYVEYTEKMIWPSRLAIFYPYPAYNLAAWQTVVSLLLLLAISILVLRLAAAHRYLLTGWLWYLGTLVPVIGLIQVGSQALADRYSYITLTGLFIIIAWGLPDLLAKWRYKKIVLASSALLIILAMSICTHFQLRHWRNSLTLFQYALDVTKDNYMAHFCIAGSLHEQGRLDEAIDHCSEAIRIKPDFFDALTGLGVALYEKGRVDEAITYYEKALEINPHSVPAHANLGLALAAKGKFDEAISLYNKALQTAPDSIELRINLGFVLTESGRLAEAVEEYKKILLIQPQSTLTHNNLGTILFRQGKFDQAVGEYRKSLRIKPDDPNVLNALGLTLGQQRKFDEAIEHFKQAIRIDPNYTAAKNNLNRALAEKQKLQNKTTENTKE
jgi:Flp pilus assembly protein TadD